MNFQEIIRKPTLIVDTARVERNIARMVKRCHEAGAVFRPHFKTHQSGLLAELFRQKGVEQITVASVSMARYFAQHGWHDITIAFPFNIREISELKALEQYTKINLVISSADTLAAFQESLTNPYDLFIKIDTGYGRAGIEAGQTDEVEKLFSLFQHSQNTRLAGLLAHGGHTYRARGIHEIQQIADEGHQKLDALRKKLDPGLLISWGDTPSCSKAAMKYYFDEWRPGNFVFYDLMQYHLGSCSLDDIAVVVACPVVETQKQKNRIVIYGGAIHFSHEFIEADNDFRLYGYVVRFTETGWTAPVAGAWLESLSQEHGIVRTSHELNDLKTGDIIGILPVHSCLTVSALGQMLDLNGSLIPCMK
ncbi:MAG: alanine racemase [Bacteroidales bacterium]|nr:alanine racemase [Bacteroidales bacterium]